MTKPLYIPTRQDLLRVYESDVKSAYADRLEGYRRYLEKQEGSLLAQASHCGAELGAAHKRCKRDLVFAYLVAARESGVDITPTLAENVCAALIGRGVDVRRALEIFATPGRTAADKSKVPPEVLDKLVAELGPMVEGLVLAMTQIRVRYRDEFDAAVQSM